MSASTRSKISSSYAEYKKKFDEADYDLRQQALYDLGNEIRHVQIGSSSSKRSQDNTYADEHIEKQYTNDVLQLVLHDSNSGVKNEAVKCLEVMTAKSRPASINLIIRALLDGLTSSEEETRDIVCPALKRVIQVVPPETAQLSQTIEVIIKRAFSILTSTTPSPDPQIASELLQVLKDIYLRFPDKIVTSKDAQSLSLTSLISIFSTSRNNSIRKRATEAVPALFATNPQIFNTDFRNQLESGLRQDGEAGNAWIGLVAALAKEQSIVGKMGAMVAEGKVIDIILEHTSDTEQVDSVEAALVTIESLILRCPTEIAPHIPQVLQRSLDLVKHDPNYVELADDDVDMEDDDDADEDDDFEEEAYSDEEDLSWKIRRAAAKVLYALIGTRNELLVDFYKSAAPVLIARFSEREDSVRLEVMAAVEALLKQTARARAADAAANGRNKRKRNDDMDEDESEESAIKYLAQSHGQLLNATLKQLNSKSIATRQQCFVILRQADEALNGGLEGEADAICSAAIAAVRSVDTATSTSLAMDALSFLASFFRHHSARVYASHLDDLVPAIIRCMKDNLQRINFEAFNAASALAQSLRPAGSASPLAVNYSKPVRQLFNATTDTLADTSVDGEVRERAMETLGHLLVHEGDVLVDSLDKCLPLITNRLRAETTAVTAVSVISRIAESPLCRGADLDEWLLNVLPDIVVALRKTRRSSSKNAEFSCLQSVLTRVGHDLPSETAQALVGELKPFLEAPLGLSTLSLILSLQPESRSTVEHQIVPQILQVVKTPSLHPQAVDGLASFFRTYVAGDPDCVSLIVPSLVENLGASSQLPDATQGGTSVYATTAKCIGAAVQSSGLSGAFNSFRQTIESGKGEEANTYLALLCIGEIGRHTDLSSDSQVFSQVLSYFDDRSEEVRSAAAFAAGNLAVGSPQVFLPLIIREIQTSTSEAKRLLILHALKEVVLHSPQAQLESLADSLWDPLFAEADVADTTNSKKSKKPKVGGADIGDDGIRNVKAACIGKLTTTAPSKYLPKLQTLLHSSPRDRAIVAAAVRYTFIDTSSAYDELIAPIIVDFLSLMHDENLIVRRLSLASLNAAIQNKPHLIIDRLPALQPLLYQETYVKPELQREVQMGPFKMIEDDGLENRKTAYETMYTLLGTCFAKVDIPTFTDRVIESLKDVNEVKVLGLMLLLRLGQLAPQSIIPRLDDVAESLKVIMKDVEVKDDTVKQDLERKEEMQRSTLRTAVPLFRMSNPAQAPVFHAFVSSLLAKNEWKEYRDYEG